MDEISDRTPTFPRAWRLGSLFAAVLFVVGVPPRAVSSEREAFPTPAIDTAVFAVG